MKRMIFSKVTKVSKKGSKTSRKSIKKLVSDLRRGVSIVELAVALAIISIVSGSALSIMLASSNNESKVMREIEVTNQAENAVECFRYVIDANLHNNTLYADEEKKIAGLKDLLNQTAGNLYQVSDNDNKTITLSRYAYTITITVDFSNNTLKFESVDRDQKEIYSLNYKYTKG